MQPFDYIRPRNLEEASHLLAQAGKRARVLAGGADLLIGLEHGMVSADWLIDIKHLPETTGLSLDPVEGLRCGAAVTLRQLTSHPEVRRIFPLLVEACDHIGSVQIRNRATVGGTICSASPASSLATVLLCYDTQCHVFGPEGERNLPLSEFFLGFRLTALTPGELLTQIVLPLPARHTKTAYHQLRIGSAGHPPLVGVAVAASLNPDRQGDWRLALTSVAPHPYRARQAEALLAGPLPTPATLHEAVDAVEKSSQPIDDHRASAAYRLAMVRVLARRALEEVAGQLAGGSP